MESEHKIYLENLVLHPNTDVALTAQRLIADYFEVPETSSGY